MTELTDNNMVEAFNGTLLDHRRLPILSLLEEVRRSMMLRIVRKRNEGRLWQGNVGPKIREMIVKRNKIALKCTVAFNGDTGYEIDCGDDTFVVDLGRKTCTCRLYQMSGIPCEHAIFAIKDLRGNIEDFVSSWFHQDVYFKIYGRSIEPVPGRKDWPRGTEKLIHPPGFKSKPGRPVTARRKALEEPKKLGLHTQCPQQAENEPVGPPTAMSRKGIIVACSLCHKQGHNKRSCALRAKKLHTQTEMSAQSGPASSSIPASNSQTREQGQTESSRSRPQKQNVQARVEVGTQLFQASASTSVMGVSGNARVSISSPTADVNTSASASATATKKKNKVQPALSQPQPAGRCFADSEGRLYGMTGGRTSPKSKNPMGNVIGKKYISPNSCGESAVIGGSSSMFTRSSQSKRKAVDGAIGTQQSQNSSGQSKKKKN